MNSTMSLVPARVAGAGERSESVAVAESGREARMPGVATRACRAAGPGRSSYDRMIRAMVSLERHDAISLREIRREDALALQPLASNPVLALTTRFPSPYPPHGAAEFVERALAQRAAGTHYTFAILLDGAAIGTCALMEVNRDLGEAEIGYWLGVPYWGRGFGFAACAWSVEWAFDNLPIERLVANVVVGNVASEKILRRLGFRLESGPGPEAEPTAEASTHSPPDGRRLLVYRLDKRARPAAQR